MLNSLASRPLLAGARVVLTVALGLVLLGCGSDPSRPVATPAESVVTPTPIPTTPPLSLPPADIALPALAPLPASVADSAPVTEAAADPIDSAATPAPSETAPDSGQATPTSPPAEPVIDESAAPVDTALVTVASADRWSDCVLLAAETTGATALLDPISGGTTVDMTSVQLNSLASASVSCDMASAGLATSAVVDYVPTGASCLNAWLDSSGGGSVFVGLASIGWSQPTPAWAQGHLVGALDACFTGASFAADVMSVVSADSSLAGAFDAECLATSFDSSGTMRTYAQALASSPATASLSVGLGDSWVLNCANVGQMVAAAAVADGVVLSGSTMSCIDSELKSTGAIAQLIAGTADTDAVGIATIACLTDAEAAALLG